jgi:hypothetical protein
MLDASVVMAGLLLLAAASLYAERSWAEERRPVLAKPMSSQALASKRGGSEFKAVVNLNDVHGTVDNNSATNVVTGTNTITGSFAGATGLPMVIQNTGNNVLIQNSTILNVQLHP